MIISNIDSFFFSIDFKDYDEENTKLIEMLETKKELAKVDRLEEIFVEFGGRKFRIMPNGSRFHSYILHNDNLEIKLARHRSRSKNNFPVSIRLKSIYLWEKGFLNSYMETIKFIKENIKGEIIADKISRADLCCHTDELFPTPDLSVWRGNFRKVELFTYNRAVTGFSFGSFKEKNVMCRIYDKTLEIRNSGKAWFEAIWEKAGLIPTNVWNVEFQIGRKFFKDHNIDTCQDFILKMRGIWEQLTHDWINYINLDDSNVSRCSIKDEWKNIQKAYLDYCYQEPIKREVQKNYDAEKLVPLIVGVLTSYGACKQKIAFNRVLEDFQKDLKKYLKDKKGDIPVEQIIYDKLDYIYG